MEVHLSQRGMIAAAVVKNISM